MSGWEPTTGDCWGGRPIARRIADCAPRRRVVVTGIIVATDVARWRCIPAYICRLDDATGRLTLVFNGPRPVPGIVTGARCTVEATALSNGHGVALWNPHYRLEPCPRGDPADG
jgi:hypothetical protein